MGADLNNQKIFKRTENVQLTLKKFGENNFVLGIMYKGSYASVENGHVLSADFLEVDRDIYISYVVFLGDTSVLKLARFDKSTSIITYETALYGTFVHLKLVNFQQEILVFAELYTDKSRFVCIRQGNCFDLSAGGNNRWTSIINNGDSILAVLDCDHFAKQTEPINGGVMPFDGTGIRIKRKPALMTYRLNVDEKKKIYGVDKSDTDAFLQGGAEIVQLAKYNNRVYAAYMRFEKFSYVVYVTDFAKAEVVVNTSRIVRDFKYWIEGDQHVIQTIDGRIYKVPIFGGFDLEFLVGSGCSQIKLKEAPLRRCDDSDVLEVKQTRELKYYWGDLRVRTDISVNSHSTGWHCGHIDDKYVEVRHLNELDFCALCDLEAHINDDFWQELRFYNDLYNIEEHFVAFNAFEWTQVKDKPRVGNFNVLFKGRADIMRAIAEDSNTVSKLARRLQNPIREGMLIVADPAIQMKNVNWSAVPQESTFLVEIFNAKGCFEFPTCDFTPSSLSRTAIDQSFVNVALINNFKIGFVGGGGQENVGLTCVLAESLTRKSLYSALKARNCYATTGQKIKLFLSIGDAIMGDCLQRPKKNVTVKIDVMGTSDLEAVDIVTNTILLKARFKNNKCNENISIEPNFKFLYLRVKQRDGHMAWSSPIFLI
ncbi:MAG: DUF3604 domain-containing protein [Clostridiales bacterium]|jgi:hypothetical protein|nr:DUF3604 domain-containing protein [Clostridiales bacterium]